MLKGKKLKFARLIAKNVIENIPTATIWIFSTLLEMGAAGIEVFFNPSIYGDPSLCLFENLDSQKGLERKRKKLEEITIKQRLWQLQKHGFVEKKRNKYFLTKTGRLVADYVLKRKKAVNKKWDGKYRVVIFDIPEKKKEFRNWFRKELYLLKYKKLQKSVFTGKYPLPPELIKEIKSAKMGNCVNYILAEKVYKNIV